MDQKKTLILIFVVVIFGSQILGLSWNIIKGMLGLIVSLIILKLISPETHKTLMSYAPFLEVFTLNNINSFITGTVGNITKMFTTKPEKCVQEEPKKEDTESSSE